MEENMSEEDVKSQGSSGDGPTSSENPEQLASEIQTRTSGTEVQDTEGNQPESLSDSLRLEGESTCSTYSATDSNSTDERSPETRRRSRRRNLMQEPISDNSDMDSSMSTVINDTDTDSNDEDHPVLKKEKPKHRWFVLPEMERRQFGGSARLQSSDLFQRRCYGSLHCVQRLELMYKLEKHEGCVNSLNFHSNGSYLASGSDDLKVVIWDWKFGKPLLAFDTKHRGNVFQSKFMPLSGDLHIATCARDGMVRLHQVSVQEGLRSSRKLGGHRGPCHKLTVLQDQPHIVLSAGEDGVVFQHDLRNSKPEKIVTVRQDSREVALYSISSHPLNTHEFCVSGRDHIVRTYDQRKCDYHTVPLSTYYPKKKQEDFVGLHVTCAIYNYNGTEILASYNDDDIYIFDVDAPPGNFIHQYQGHRNGATIKGVNFFGPKSEFVVSGSDCGNIYFWEKNTEAVVNWMSADENGVVNCIEPHPQLPFLCTSGLDWDVKVWVPSCEENPQMTDLPATVKANNKARRGNYDNNESEMLWMLWRHLRSTSRVQRFSGNEFFLGFENANSSSDSSSSSNSVALRSEDDSDDEGGPPGCTTS